MRILALYCHQHEDKKQNNVSGIERMNKIDLQESFRRWGPSSPQGIVEEDWTTASPGTVVCVQPDALALFVGYGGVHQTDRNLS